MIKIIIEKLGEQKIDDDLNVKMTYMGNVIHKQYIAKRNIRQTIQMIDKDNYIVLSDNTGELHQCEHIENRSQGVNSLKRTFRVLRGVINNNVIDNSKCRWLTLTYSDNMTDDKKLKVDLMHFIKRMRDTYGKFEYISVREPQGRGAWHFHMFLIFNNKAPFMENKKVYDLWKKGWVTVKGIDDACDDIGAYFTAYLCDMEYSEASEQNMIEDGVHYDIKEVEVTENDGTKVNKKILKGFRLCLYPPNMNLYTCSSGIKKPIIEVIKEKDAKQKVSSAKLTFQENIKIIDEKSGFENIIINSYYNTKRK